jgi:hypothetical protein
MVVTSVQIPLLNKHQFPMVGWSLLLNQTIQNNNTSLWNSPTPQLWSGSFFLLIRLAWQNFTPALTKTDSESFSLQNTTTSWLKTSYS